MPAMFPEAICARKTDYSLTQTPNTPVEVWQIYEYKTKRYLIVDYFFRFIVVKFLPDIRINSNTHNHGSPIEIGLLLIIMANCGTQYFNELSKKIKHSGIKKINSVPYHHQLNRFGRKDKAGHYKYMRSANAWHHTY